MILPGPPRLYGSSVFTPGSAMPVLTSQPGRRSAIQGGRGEALIYFRYPAADPDLAQPSLLFPWACYGTEPCPAAFGAEVKAGAGIASIGYPVLALRNAAGARNRGQAFQVNRRISSGCSGENGNDCRGEKGTHRISGG